MLVTLKYGVKSWLIAHCVQQTLHSNLQKKNYLFAYNNVQVLGHSQPKVDNI